MFLRRSRTFGTFLGGEIEIPAAAAARAAFAEEASASSRCVGEGVRDWAAVTKEAASYRDGPIPSTPEERF